MSAAVARRAKSPDTKRLPEAISIQQAAQLMGVCEMTVRRWIRGGFIQACRVGPHLIRIPRSEVARMRKNRVLYVERSEYPNSDRPKYPKV